jgi:hypothetical protein
MELKRPDESKIPKRLRHVSTWSNRDSILSIGLLPNIGDTYSNYWLRTYPNESLIPTIFLCAGIYTVINKGFERTVDVWEINTEDLDLNYLYEDPAFEKSRKKSYMYFKTIPIEHLKLIKKSPYYKLHNKYVFSFSKEKNKRLC